MRAAILALAFVSACTSARRPDNEPSWSLPDWAQGSSSGERPGSSSSSSSSTGAAESSSSSSSSSTSTTGDASTSGGPSGSGSGTSLEADTSGSSGTSGSTGEGTSTGEDVDASSSSTTGDPGSTGSGSGSSTGPEPSGCPCEPGIDNFCDLPPKTPGCAATFPGGCCDPDGDGAYFDADLNAGFLAWKAECDFLAPHQPTSIERIECATGCVLTTTEGGAALILIEDAS